LLWFELQFGGGCDELRFYLYGLWYTNIELRERAWYNYFAELKLLSGSTYIMVFQKNIYMWLASIYDIDVRENQKKLITKKRAALVH